MAFFLKIQYSKSVLFINGYHYSKFELYQDIRGVGLVLLT